MGAGRRRTVVCALWVIALGAGDIAAGQTRVAADVTRARPALPDAADAPPCDPIGGRLPATVHLDARITPHVRDMLSRSPRFRAQCRALARRPWAYVRVRLIHDDALRGTAAQSVIRKTQNGSIVALVDLGWRRDWAEWLPHELEHVLELADGESMEAFKLATGTWESSLDAFETSRAIDAGRDVRTEVRFGAHH